MIDEPCRDEQDTRLWRHLRSCEHCFNVYREAAVYRGLWESKKQAFAPTEELITAGLKIASGNVGDRRGRKPEDRFRSKPWHRRTFLYISSAAAAAVAVFLIWYLMGDGHGPSPAVPPRPTYGPVKKAVEYVTKCGAFVLPGGEGAISTGNGFSYRSGYMPLNSELRTSLDSMFEAFREGDCSEDLMYWLIAGHVATGQMKTAREIVEHARKLGIEGSRVIIIDAIIAYAFADQRRAERLLRDLCEADPGNCIARINLAVVLLEQGDTAEGREILEIVAGTCANIHLQTRARALLANH